MTYRVVFTSKAAKELRKLAKSAQTRILAVAGRLEDDPRPSGTKKLTGRDEYRVRAGDYRIIYTVEDDVVTVTVIKVGHRRDVYEG